MVLQVGDPQLVVKLANELMSGHGVYLQPINYPTVPRGQELLRIAPTPHHSRAMMDQLVDAALTVWLNNGLQLTRGVATGNGRCALCQRPIRHDRAMQAAGQRVDCDGSRCQEYITAAA